MSMLMLVVSISPILAPLTGSLVIATVGWRGVFGVLTVASIVALVLTATQLNETRPPEQRRKSSWRGAFEAYVDLFLDPVFTGLTLVGAFGISAFFVYLGSASFVLIDHYGLTPMQFSLCFALNAASFFGVSQLTGVFVRRFGLASVIRAAAAGFASAMCLLAGLAMVGVESLPIVMALLFIGYGFLGLVLPTTAVLSLEDHGDAAGTASALMGAMQMVIGAALMALAGVFADGSPRPMILGIAGCALSTLVFAEIVLRHMRKNQT
jgi:DHA1 family bicyclomycin/chloramphenicol resistance-like MFS transporter